MSGIGKAIAVSVVSSVCGGAAWLALEPEARRFVGIETPAQQAPPPAAAPEAEEVSAVQATPSFDCAAAEAAIERLICSDAWLAEADQMISARWSSLRDADLVTPDLVGAQRDWIQHRNACVLEDEAQSCVRRAYRERIAELDALAAAPAVMAEPAPSE